MYAVTADVLPARGQSWKTNSGKKRIGKEKNKRCKHERVENNFSFKFSTLSEEFDTLEKNRWSKLYTWPDQKKI